MTQSAGLWHGEDVKPAQEQGGCVLRETVSLRLHFSIVASKAFLHTGSFGNTERNETAHFFPPISTAPFSFRILKNF